MRKYTLAGLCAVAVAALAGVGCDTGKPKAAGEGGSPPPENSEMDKAKIERPTPPPAPGGLAPPKKGG